MGDPRSHQFMNGCAVPTLHNNADCSAWINYRPTYCDENYLRSYPRTSTKTYGPPPRGPHPSIPLERNQSFGEEILDRRREIYCDNLISRAVVRPEQRHIHAYVRSVTSRGSSIALARTSRCFGMILNRLALSQQCQHESFRSILGSLDSIRNR